MTTNLSLKRVVLPIALALGAIAAPPAFAISKDMEQLQTQIKDLQDAVARLQQSNDERGGVMKDLVQQSADSVNKMSLNIDTLQKLVRSQQETTGTKLEGVAGQMQSINDSIDEIKARLSRLEKTLQEVQSQEQSINATMQNLAPPPAAAGAVPDATGSAVQPLPPPAKTAPQQAPIVNRRGKPNAGVPMSDVTAPVADPGASGLAAAAPAASDLYKTALSDYMAAKYTLAASEFSEVVRIYPQDSLAGNAFYYQGEIDYRAGKYAAAAKDYDHVLEQFPDNPKTAVSHLHKGMALFELKQNEAGIREMRTVITRFPGSPEATTARSKLNGMGVPIVPKQRP